MIARVPGMRLSSILTLVLVLILILFTIQNANPIRIHFLQWSFTASRVVVIFLAFTAGLLIGWTGRRR
ncbi:MAG: LapA family protein [Candidatus Omnitrophica bacterium]|nr:LapA family protein [Candidatus Omnitrophota bacterium]